MNILITGATGFVGRHLIKSLNENHEVQVKVLTRNKEKAKSKFDHSVRLYEWDVANNFIDPDALRDTDIIVNLAGENVGEKRWSQKRKDQLYKSRINTTELLLQKIIDENASLKKFISASAIGYYGSSEIAEFTEDSPPGNDFLAQLCVDWEKAANNEIAKTIVFRIGLVLGDGGALDKMLPIFKAGLGGILGSGQQYMSWIHLHDLVKQIEFLIFNDTKYSVYNCVSPSPITNKEFTKALGSALKRPVVLPAPSFALKIALGEMSALVLNGQRVQPKSFIEEGFDFKYSTIDSALASIV